MPDLKKVENKPEFKQLNIHNPEEYNCSDKEKEKFEPTIKLKTIVIFLLKIQMILISIIFGYYRCVDINILSTVFYTVLILWAISLCSLILVLALKVPIDID